MAQEILNLLSSLYDNTFGRTIKLSEPDKFIVFISNLNFGNGLKEFFDSRRKVFGMKPIESMPKTFQYFHSKAKRISSQLDQDGVIEAIFEAIKDKHTNKKYFVEVGGGSEVDNTAYLRQQKGWSGKLFNSGAYYMGRTRYPITN